MTKWEYKSVLVERTGTKEDFGFTWTYGAWEMRTETGTKQPLLAGLRRSGERRVGTGRRAAHRPVGRGRPRWECVPGVRTIAGTLLFKRPLGGGAKGGAGVLPRASPPAPLRSREQRAG